jgi:hypothetical protein
MNISKSFIVSYESCIVNSVHFNMRWEKFCLSCLTICCSLNLLKQTVNCQLSTDITEQCSCINRGGLVETGSGGLTGRRLKFSRTEISDVSRSFRFLDGSYQWRASDVMKVLITRRQKNKWLKGHCSAFRNFFYNIEMPFIISVDHNGHAVWGTNCLRPLERWDSGFESHSRHGCLCVRFFYVLCIGSRLATGWSPSKESYRLYKKDCKTEEEARAKQRTVVPFDEWMNEWMNEWI